MPDDLYDRDILAWSEHQARLLRRMASGERVNEVDWEHVIEEVQDVGLSELHSVESFLELFLVHLLKAQVWPASESLNHWHAAMVTFQSNAVRRFSPSMRQRIDLAPLYQTAARQVMALAGDQVAVHLPGVCPFTLDQLLNEEWSGLKQALADACAACSG